LNLLRTHPLSQLHRREASTAQDLIRIGIADAREEARIGQRPLQRVVLSRQRVRERGEVALQRLDAAAVHVAERRLAA
jgi:hypothetical protein